MKKPAVGRLWAESINHTIGRRCLCYHVQQKFTKNEILSRVSAVLLLLFNYVLLLHFIIIVLCI